jgi:hypothetical protein
MATVSALGSRPVQSPVLPAFAHSGARAGGAQTVSASGYAAARLPVVESVAQSQDTVSLSRQGLAARADRLGSATVDVAQQFLSNFAKKLFGAAADGATLTFDGAALSTEASFSALAGQASGPDGSAASAAVSLSESAHFIGKGTIVTADGQQFQFEIEVRYEASVQASSSHRAPAVAAPDLLALTGKQLPEIEFPGSLADLFKLLGRELQASVPSDEGLSVAGKDGSLSLRLLRLVNTAALLAPRAQPDEQPGKAMDRSKALASSYGAAPARTDPGNA